ncbi:hypothetical protein, partial [Hydrogenimonas sp.]
MGIFEMGSQKKAGPCRSANRRVWKLGVLKAVDVLGQLFELCVAEACDLTFHQHTHAVFVQST